MDKCHVEVYNKLRNRNFHNVQKFLTKVLKIFIEIIINIFIVFHETDINRIKISIGTKYACEVMIM